MQEDYSNYLYCYEEEDNSKIWFIPAYITLLVKEIKNVEISLTPKVDLVYTLIIRVAMTGLP